MSLDTPQTEGKRKACSPESEHTLQEAIQHARKYLPDQGPIGVFIHHNTLHHFENLPFETAVEQVGSTLGAEPYMSHSQYIDAYFDGRFSKQDIGEAVQMNLSRKSLPVQTPTLNHISQEKFLRKLCLIPKITENSATLSYLLEEKHYLRKFSRQTSEHSKEKIRKEFETSQKQFSNNEKIWTDSELDSLALNQLWEWVKESIQIGMIVPTSQKQSLKYSFDDRINQILINFLNVFLDQGVSFWKLPDRESGLLNAFLSLTNSGERAIPHFASWTSSQILESIDPQNLILSIDRVLAKLKVSDERKHDFIFNELLKLPGWTGTLSLLEERPDLLPVQKLPVKVTEYLLIRLILVASHVGKKSLSHYEIAHPIKSQNIDSLQLEIFLFLQSLGFGFEECKKMAKATLIELVTTVQIIGDRERRRVLHQAFELSFKNQLMDSLAVNARANEELVAPAKFQSLFCIDDREESFRRHLEEVEPECETYGVVGFFGLDIRYQGLHENQANPLCPVVITPKIIIREKPKKAQEKSHHLILARKSSLQKIHRNLYDQSRDFLGGSLFTILGGLLSCIPMFFSIHFPRLTGKFIKKLHSHFFPVIDSELTLEREENTENESGFLTGFTEDEMAERVFSVLNNAGLRQFSKLVLVIGHGSSSLNNPHESAYDCGACGGRRGGPNARAFSEMANRPGVRSRLIQKGLNIPSTTYFLGGYHDTCSDNVYFFETHQIPKSLKLEFEEINNIFRRTRMFNAHERCRRFEDANKFSPAYALRHVEGRAQNLREPRPEYGHSSNASCIIGRRILTRDLFLDRRAFLVSYNPFQDPESKQLTSILSAVIPVCAGISLEYYFSYVDNEKYGCGTKLPHNVTGLIGVMNGSLSDLRTGLTWQMVEIHEPMRLVTIIDCTQAQLTKALQNLPAIKNLVDHQWIQLGYRDPFTLEMASFQNGQPVLHTVQTSTLKEFSTSRSYYERRTEHLPPALITKRGSTW